MESAVPSGGDPVEVMGWYVRYITLYDCIVYVGCVIELCNTNRVCFTIKQG